MGIRGFVKHRGRQTTTRKLDIDVQEIDFSEGQFKSESDGRMKLVGKIYKCQNLRLGKGRDAQTVVDISAKVQGESALVGILHSVF